MSYKISLPQFEGPFDLLLFFIERDELDVYDIPIAQVTMEFLDYLKELEQIDIDAASEFILVASTLMRIKAKMLIPRKDLDEDGNEIDPREELVQRLLEYKKYKAVLEDLQFMEDNRSNQFERGNRFKELSQIAKENEGNEELESLSLFKLLKAFEKVMTKYSEEQKKPKHTVSKYNYTIGGQKKSLLSLISKYSRMNFSQVFKKAENRVHAIFSFLAMLELVQLKELTLVLGDNINDFWIEKI